MGSFYLGGPTIQEVDGEMMMGLSIYGVAVMDGLLYSRFYGIYIYQYENSHEINHTTFPKVISQLKLHEFNAT